MGQIIANFPRRFTVLFLTIPRYESARKIRVSVIHGLARMAAIMASTYKAYLGVGLGPLSVRLGYYCMKIRLKEIKQILTQYFECNS